MIKGFLLFVPILLLAGCQAEIENKKIIILISANAEWKIVKQLFPNEQYKTTSWGEYFEYEVENGDKKQPLIFFHEGWGKVAGAGATQYAIDKWNPEILINLGTCGGFEESVNKYEILLIDRTIIYDIKEAMGDSEEAIHDYSTQLDLQWINIPDTIRKTLLLSGDRDLIPGEIEFLKEKYQAIAGDWESGAIAYTCKRNNKKLLVLRGVTDLVNSDTGESYGNPGVFQNGTEIVMRKLINDLPTWIAQMKRDQLSQSK